MLPRSAAPAPETVAPAAVAPAPVALEIVETPVARREEPASAPGWSPELATMRVRQFFGRLVMAAPGAAEVDLGEWPRLTVERFFLAVGSPRAMARREAPTGGGEAVSLGNAFEGFEWD